MEGLWTKMCVVDFTWTRSWIASSESADGWRWRQVLSVLLLTWWTVSLLARNVVNESYLCCAPRTSSSFYFSWSYSLKSYIRREYFTIVFNVTWNLGKWILGKDNLPTIHYNNKTWNCSIYQFKYKYLDWMQCVFKC